MDVRIVQAPAARIAGLNPFDLASAAGEVRQAQHIRVKKQEYGARSRQLEDQIVDEPEEFGCVDWFLYPDRGAGKGLGARD